MSTHDYIVVFVGRSSHEERTGLVRTRVNVPATDEELAVQIEQKCSALAEDGWHLVQTMPAVSGSGSGGINAMRFSIHTDGAWLFFSKADPSARQA